MRKVVLVVLMLALVLSAFGVPVSAQDATATPAAEPTLTPTPLPPVEFAEVPTEFTGDSNNFAGVDPTGQTITYWNQYVSATQLAVITGLVNQFNATNPYHITVNNVPKGGYGDLTKAMNAAIVSGDLPNLVAGYNNDALSYDLDSVVVDLTPYYNDAKWGYSGDAAAELNQDILNAFVTPDGRRIGWVNQVSGEVMAVNNTMLKTLGYDAPPATLAEFQEISCKASTAGLTGAEGAAVQGFPIVADSSQFESFVASIGGSIWVDGKWNFTNDAVLQILNMYHDMYAQKCAYIPQGNFANTNEWAKALNPMAITSTAGIGPILGGIAAANNIVTDWQVVPTPPLNAGDKPALQLFTPGIIPIAGTPEQQLASWIFLRYFTQADVSQQWAQAMSFFPVNLTAAKNYQAANPYFASAVDWVAKGSVSIYISPAQISYGTVRGIVATGIADITSGGMDVATVAQRMTDDSNKALAGG